MSYNIFSLSPDIPILSSFTAKTAKVFSRQKSTVIRFGKYTQVVKVIKCGDLFSNITAMKRTFCPSLRLKIGLKCKLDFDNYGCPAEQVTRKTMNLKEAVKWLKLARNIQLFKPNPKSSKIHIWPKMSNIWAWQEMFHCLNLTRNQMSINVQIFKW